MEAQALDHIALWTAEREAIADYVTARLGMHVIERTEAFTLVGADARQGKLTLFEAEGPRRPGALKHVGIRVRDPGSDAGETEVADGLRVRLVEATGGLEYDLDHVALYSPRPDETAEAYLSLGFESAEAREDGVPRVQSGGRYVEFHSGDPDGGERPLLNHIALLCNSAEQQREEAERMGLEIADFVDAANTIAVFVWGPDRVKIEYVEHKPGFSLV
jgi:catechol 2,3-dioxygenase-like lactoylglutathione lyase family enzyme